jgi:hypothetical protein
LKLRGVFPHLLNLLKAWMKPCTRTTVSGGMVDLTRTKTELVLENALLRQHIVVLKRHVKRPQLTGWDRAGLVCLASRCMDWKSALLIVKPETLLRWHRELFP